MAPPLPQPGSAGGFFLLKGSFSFPLSPKCLLIGGHMIVGFFSVSMKRLEATFVVICLTLPLAYERLTNSHILRWAHNNTVIFYRQGKVSTGKPEDITSKGSLVLKKILFSSQGIYQGHVLHPNNTSAKTWTGRLCVLDKVSKPQLSYSCDFSSMAVNLNCHVTKPEGLVFSWTLDKETLKSETKQTLSISFIDLKAERSFTCDVANKISKASSDKVRPTCPPLLSFKRQTVMAVLAGGGGLILFLLFVIVGLCCLLRRDKSQTSPRDKGELRMLSLQKQESHSVSPEHKNNHPTEVVTPPLIPQPSPRTYYQNVPQLEVQTENSPSLMYEVPDRPQPSPVPKPRTRNLQQVNT
uniref:Ig-like domain-containing protein n=1 Tax=Pundamilia nyererei TaxID=303518 RepID=A0A3B4F9R6_9CICH